jgi:hypothetical protein
MGFEAMLSSNEFNRRARLLLWEHFDQKKRKAAALPIESKSSRGAKAQAYYSCVQEGLAKEQR